MNLFIYWNGFIGIGLLNVTELPLIYWIGFTIHRYLYMHIQVTSIIRRCRTLIHGMHPFIMYISFTESCVHKNLSYTIYYQSLSVLCSMLGKCITQFYLFI